MIHSFTPDKQNIDHKKFCTASKTHFEVRTFGFLQRATLLNLSATPRHWSSEGVSDATETPEVDFAMREYSSSKQQPFREGGAVVRNAIQAEAVLL